MALLRVVLPARRLAPTAKNREVINFEQFARPAIVIFLVRSVMSE
jgi:hypothetical protein